MWPSVWSSLVAVFYKELVHIRRDRGTIVIAVVIPLFQLMLFGFIDQRVTNIPTVVVDQDRTRYSRELIDALRATHTFTIELVTGDPRLARAEIIAGRAKVAFAIPPDYHSRRTRTAKVLLLIDGSDSNVSAQALAAANGVASWASSRSQAAWSDQPVLPSLSMQPIVLFNPDGRTANFIIPGLVAILLQVIAVSLTAVSIVRERERGTLEQLLVTPVHPLGLMLGKLAPYLAVGVVEMSLVLSLMRFGFNVPIRGNLFFLFGMAIIYLFALLSMGLFISTRASTQARAQQMSQFFLLPSFFLSGYIFPQAGLPFVLRWFGRLLPATHMVEIMRGVVLRDAGPIDLAPNVLALVAISVVMVTLSVRRFRKFSA